jgi:hypothetical protein
MILTLDNLASKYHCLPSEALARSTTFDLYVLDVSTKWYNHQHERAQNDDSSTITPELSVEQMQAMIARVKERK